MRQVVHHVPDSHLNSYIRFRWALTEDDPTIKTYYEGRWAELPDARTAPVGVSLALLESLHGRWGALLGSLTDQDWKRTFQHPVGSGESRKERGALCVARPASRGAYHGVARADGVEVEEEFKNSRIQEVEEGGGASRVTEFVGL